MLLIDLLRNSSSVSCRLVSRRVALCRIASRHVVLCRVRARVSNDLQNTVINARLEAAKIKIREHCFTALHFLAARKQLSGRSMCGMRPRKLKDVK